MPGLAHFKEIWRRVTNLCTSSINLNKEMLICFDAVVQQLESRCSLLFNEKMLFEKNKNKQKLRANFEISNDVN